MLQRLAGDDKAALDLVEDLFVGHEKDSFFVRSQGSMLVIHPCKWERKKASPSGLRPQARVEAQPPEAALSAETEAVTEGD